MFIVFTPSRHLYFPFGSLTLRAFGILLDKGFFIFDFPLRWRILIYSNLSCSFQIGRSLSAVSAFCITSWVLQSGDWVSLFFQCSLFYSRPLIPGSTVRVWLHWFCRSPGSIGHPVRPVIKKVGPRRLPSDSWLCPRSRTLTLPKKEGVYTLVCVVGMCIYIFIFICICVCIYYFFK